MDISWCCMATRASLCEPKSAFFCTKFQIPRTWNACSQLSWTNLYNPRDSLGSKIGLTILPPFIRKQSVSQGKLAQTIAFDSSSHVCLRTTPGNGLTTVNCIVINEGYRRFLAQAAEVAVTRRRGRVGHECAARMTTNEMRRYVHEAEEWRTRCQCGARRQRGI